MPFVELKSRNLSKDERDEGKRGVLSALGLTTFFIFLAALAVRLWFSFFDGHETIIWSCDASEYLRCAKSLSAVLTDASGHIPEIFLYLLGALPAAESGTIEQIFAPIKGLATQAGPTFPAFLIFSYLVTGSPISAEYSQSPVLIQCILTSVSCALIAYIGTKCWNLKVGATAGILAIIYPGFIVNSLRLYSESYATFWLLVSLAIFTKIHFSKNSKLSIFLGFAMGVLQGARSALVLMSGWILATLSVFSGKSQAVKIIPLTIAGILIAVIPCMVLQNLSIGKSSFVQNRVGHYNIFVGLDVNSQGWLSYPYPDGSGIEKENFLGLIKRRYDESHSRFTKLLMDKPIRLFKFPWNDFRTPVGIFGIQSQVIIHQICLLLAAIGVCASMVWKKEESEEFKARLTLLGIFALHAAYFFFITVPRYGLTAMPIMLLFAGAGLCYLAQLIRSKQKDKLPLNGILLGISAGLVVLGTRFDFLGLLSQIICPTPENIFYLVATTVLFKLAIISWFFIQLFVCVKHLGALPKWVTVALALLVIPFVSLPLRAHGRILEWHTNLNRNSAPVISSISIPENSKSTILGNQCYLMIDLDNWSDASQKLKVKLNGKNVKANFMPLMPFAQNFDDPKSVGKQKYYECENIYKSVLNACGGLNLDIRQWFILPLNEEIAASIFENEESPKLNLELTGNEETGLNLYGSYPQHNEYQYIPSVTRYSWEKCLYGVENESGFTDSRFDEKYFFKQNFDSKDLSNLPGIQTGSYNVRLLVAKGSSLPQLAKTGTVTRSPIESSSILDNKIIETSTLPFYNDDTIWNVTFNGTIESKIDQTINFPVNVDAIVKSKKGETIYHSPWVPTSVQLTPGINEFNFSLPIKPSKIGMPNSIQLSISRGGVADSTQYFGTFYKPESKIGNLSRASFEKEIRTKLRWKSTSIEIKELTQYPIALGFEIF